MSQDEKVIAATPARIPLDLRNVKAYRLARSESQTVFWQRFLVTQSSGSRYEQGAKISPTLGMLITGWAAGLITEGQLAVLAHSYRNNVGEREA